MKLFLLLLILINIFYSIINYNFESYHNYRMGHGWGFGFLHPGQSFQNYYYPNPVCLPENSCFRGLPDRGSLYSNMCEPKYKNLLRDKIYTQGECYRAHIL